MWPSIDYAWFDGAPLVEIPEEATTEHFLAGFRDLGYEKCGLDASFEFGYQKVAIYANDVGVTHMARQHFCGRGWLSKIGDWEDIFHKKVTDVCGDMSPDAVQYGKVVQILKRKWFDVLRTGCMYRQCRHVMRHWIDRFSHPSWDRLGRSA